MFKNGNSPAVQWLGLHTSPAKDLGLIPGWETKISQVAQHGQKKEKKSSRMMLLKQKITLKP